MKTKLLIVFALCTFNLFSQTNLVPNGGFETWTNSTTLSNWTVENSVTQNTFLPAKGSYSANLSLTSSLIPKISIPVSLVAGTTYIVKYKYKYLNTNFGGTHPITLSIQNGGNTSLTNSSFASNNSWTQKQTTFTADQTIAYDLSISINSFDAEFFGVSIDEVQIYAESDEKYTLIPDPKFEDELIYQLLDSGPRDGKVVTSNISELVSLDVSFLNISNLTGIQDFVGLKTLDCSFNNLTSLNLSKNLLLLELNVKNCKLTSLDLSKNVALKKINCQYNQLTSLNVKNGNNTLLTSQDLFFKFNTNLTCIQVDDVAYSNTNWSTQKEATAEFNTDCTPYTLIPDLNFENKLIDLGIDSAPANGKVLTSSINTLTTLNVSNSSINDLTGIQDFVALQSLDCQENNLTTLDLSKNGKLIDVNCSTNKLTNFINTSNLALTDLYCDSNQLTSLDVSKYTALTNLTFSSNKITTIDVSSNTLLVQLWCDSNLLTELNITKNTSLINLNCGYNQLTNLNVTKNASLTALYCYNNQITSLNVSQNINLQEFMCNSNEIKTIDVSNNPKLEMFDCLDNKITSLDISKNPLIYELACENNQLTYLNLKNGANTILKLTFSNFVNNPNLKCIQVDDVAYSNSKWSTKKDATATYSLTCTTLGIEDSVFDKIAIYPNPTKGELHIDNIVLEKATVYDALGKLVKTATFNSGANDNMIHLTGLPKGIYYVYLESEGANTAKKIIVE